MASLLVIKGYNTGVSYELTDKIRIGRSSDNDIQLVDRSISRFHCKLEHDGKDYVLTDLNSTYGVLVNGEKLEETRTLAKDDIVEIGNTRLVFNAGYSIRNTRFGNKSVVFGGLTASSTKTWSTDLINLPRVDLTEQQKSIRAELTELAENQREAPPELLGRMLQRIALCFNAQRVASFIFDPITGEITPLAAEADSDVLPVSTAVLDEAFRENKAIISTEAALEPNMSEALNIKHLQQHRALMCAPVFDKNRPIGIIYLEQTRDHTFEKSDLSVLQTFAHICSQTMLHAFQNTLDEHEARATHSLFLGSSRRSQEILEKARQLAATGDPLLIIGETGVGKDILAQEIHRMSPRENYPFVGINCASVPDNQLEVELFGHEKGAFAGAHQLKIGLIERAHGGTLFLDEIGSMSEEVQPKILRLMQDRVFNRVGGSKPIHVDVRIIASTHCDPNEESHPGFFRWNLFMKHNVGTLNVPPLSRRKEDIQALAYDFLHTHCERLHKHIKSIDEQAMEDLLSYRWPGNARELHNCIERAVLLCRGRTIKPSDLLLPERYMNAPHESIRNGKAEVLPLKEVERRHILHALEANDWNQAQTAEQLQIHRNTLRRKIQEYKLIR
ncbi:sigma 54-interacting transcriptional regulator [Candidatus Sumerlaeota bacterium]|nr:sigma 54-interacting transcriptional regulator [Candidatus Sumerlaeota bacterium]